MGQGKPGKDGNDGTNGKDGKDGKDGIGILQPDYNAETGELKFRMTDGNVKNVGNVKGKEGPIGKIDNDESVKKSIADKVLWCADGNICQLPKNVPIAAATGATIIKFNNRLNVPELQGVELGAWRLHTTPAGSLVMSNDNKIIHEFKPDGTIKLNKDSWQIEPTDTWVNFNKGDKNSVMSVGPTGDIWSKHIGGASNTTAGGWLSAGLKTGDINTNNAYIGSWRINSDDKNNLNYKMNNDDKFSIGPNGDIWSKYIGGTSGSIGGWIGDNGANINQLKIGNWIVNSDAQNNLNYSRENDAKFSLGAGGDIWSKVVGMSWDGASSRRGGWLSLGMGTDSFRVGDWEMWQQENDLAMYHKGDSSKKYWWSKPPENRWVGWTRI